MRVTFVLPDANLGGGTRMIAQHADVLQRRGHCVTILSTPPPRISQRRKIGSLLTGRGWPVPKPGPSHLDGLGLDHRVRPRRAPLSDHEAPDADVVVATWWETAEWVARLSPRKGVKAYFIQHYEAHLGMPEDRVAATWRLPMQKIVCARWLADLARERFDDPDAMYVRNGLNMELFDAPPRGRNARPTVGMVYSPSPAKGCESGFAAVELARREVPDLRLHVFGSSEPTLTFPPDSVWTSRPPQHQIREIYAECDVWLCSSRREGYHMPPLEAMACRCPAVATRVGGPGDVIDEGVNGFLVDVDDVGAMARRLVDVIRMSEADWKRMSDSAYSTARGFTSEDAGVEFEQALAQALERVRGGSLLGSAGGMG